MKQFKKSEEAIRYLLFRLPQHTLSLNDVRVLIFLADMKRLYETGEPFTPLVWEKKGGGDIFPVADGDITFLNSILGVEVKHTLFSLHNDYKVSLKYLNKRPFRYLTKKDRHILDETAKQYQLLTHKRKKKALIREAWESI